MQGWAHILLPNAYKNRTSDDDDAASPSKETLIKGKDFKKSSTFEDDSTSTCAPSTYAPTTGSETWNTADFSSSTADFRDDDTGSTSTTVYLNNKSVALGQRLSPLPEDVDELPSEGSALHGTGTCRPCAWFYKSQGCSNGKECRHCHLCPEGEIKSRKKMKTATLQKTKVTGETVDATEMAGLKSVSFDDNVAENSASTESFKHPEDDSKACIEPPPGLVLPEEAVPARSAALETSSGELPSEGSAMHGTGACRPCAWFYRPQGCSNGKECRHCHLCPEGEIKDRKKAKVAVLKKEAAEAKENADAPGGELTNLAYAMPPLYDGSPMDMNVALPPYDMAFPPPVPFFLPSVGSGLHGTGLCKPCAWFWKPKGCANAQECFHCHLCPEGEIKHRKKIKEIVLRTVEKSAQDPSLSRNTPSIADEVSLIKSPQRVEPRTIDESETSDDEEDDEAEITSQGDASPAKVPLCAADAEPMSVPLPASLEMASTGSALHASGKCKPCAWHWKPQGCHNGRACAHCHICPEGELRNRRKAKVTALRMGAAAPSSRSMATAEIGLGGAAEQAGSKARVVSIAPILES